jgi:hypothetical protein
MANSLSVLSEIFQCNFLEVGLELEMLLGILELIFDQNFS